MNKKRDAESKSIDFNFIKKNSRTTQPNYSGARKFSLRLILFSVDRQHRASGWCTFWQCRLHRARGWCTLWQTRVLLFVFTPQPGHFPQGLYLVVFCRQQRPLQPYFVVSCRQQLPQQPYLVVFCRQQRVFCRQQRVFCRYQIIGILQLQFCVSQFPLHFFTRSFCFARRSVFWEGDSANKRK